MVEQGWQGRKTRKNTACVPVVVWLVFGCACGMNRQCVSKCVCVCVCVRERCARGSVARGEMCRRGAASGLESPGLERAAATESAQASAQRREQLSCFSRARPSCVPLAAARHHQGVKAHSLHPYGTRGMNEGVALTHDPRSAWRSPKVAALNAATLVERRACQGKTGAPRGLSHHYHHAPAGSRERQGYGLALTWRGCRQ